jgi:hypothetical protein
MPTSAPATITSQPPCRVGGHGVSGEVVAPPAPMYPNLHRGVLCVGQPLSIVISPRSSNACCAAASTARRAGSPLSTVNPRVRMTPRREEGTSPTLAFLHGTVPLGWRKHRAT